ncbi:unnamed protein product [Tuber aestivum]|uniref:Uncharacterized protein n=1 Tax=Tuber aestivum TaxID=59557 RepID=A0A292PNL8_9PEZI|nr:unnamed protein product [Tuber aestivum]
MLPSAFKEKSPESPEPPPSDAERIPREPELGGSAGGAQDDLPRLSDLTLGPNRGAETEGGGDGGGDSDDEKYQKFENLMESSLVLNYMQVSTQEFQCRMLIKHSLSGHDAPTREVSIESISEDAGVGRWINIDALGEFTVADRELDDLLRSGSPQKEVDRIRQLASRAEVTIPPEGQEEGLPRLPINDVLELTLGDPWQRMGPLKEQTFHISRRIQSLWGCVEELLSCRHKLIHLSGALAKRDELRYNLIKLGLKNLTTREISRDALKIQCFETLNLACVIIEAFIEKIAKESEKDHTGESEESEEDEESGEDEEGSDTTGSESQSSGSGGETVPKRNKLNPKAGPGPGTCEYCNLADNTASSALGITFADSVSYDPKGSWVCAGRESLTILPGVVKLRLTCIDGNKIAGGEHHPDDLVEGIQGMDNYALYTGG